MAGEMGWHDLKDYPDMLALAKKIQSGVKVAAAVYPFDVYQGPFIAVNFSASPIPGKIDERGRLSSWNAEVWYAMDESEPDTFIVRFKEDSGPLDAQNVVYMLKDLKQEYFKTHNLDGVRTVGRRQEIRNPITYEGNRFGHYLVTSVEATAWTKDIHGTIVARPPKHELYVQSDWDFPGLAETFGWNGKILPATKLRAVRIDPKDETGAQIYSAIQYLDANEGKVVEDPGYWDDEYTTEEENDVIKAAQTISVTKSPKILAIYDAPEFADRYSIYIDEKHDRGGKLYMVLCLSDNCNQPNGVNMWSSGELGDHNGKKITFEQLPPQVQKCARARLEDDAGTVKPERKGKAYLLGDRNEEIDLDKYGAVIHAPRRAYNQKRYPCPTCGTPNCLTEKDKEKGYQCDRCADGEEGNFRNER